MRDTSLRGFVPTRVDLSTLVRLAFPVAVVQVGMMAMGAVDTVMVGRVSATDLAAVALGNLYFFGVAVFGMGVLFGLDPVISQAVGAQDEVAVARGVQRGATLSLVLTVFASLLLLPAGPVLGFLRQPEDVVPVAHGYALASILGVLPFYLFNVFRQSLQAMGRVAPILLTVILANLGNVAFNWILIYGNLGFPALGAVGSGWATSLSRWLMLLLLLGFGWRRLRPSVRPLRGEALAVAPLMRFLRLGTPIGVQQMLEFGVFGAAGLLMGWIGTVAMASHQVALNLAALTFMVPVGIAQAAAVLVGQAVGRGDAPGARRAAGAGLIAGAAFMSGTAALFLSSPLFLAGIYSADPAVVALAALLIPIAGVFQVFDGIQVVGAGVLRGVGDTRIPMVMNLLGFWVVGLPVSAFLAFGLTLGPQGVWIGLALGIGAVALLLLGRVRARFGQDLRRLVIEDEDAGGGTVTIPIRYRLPLFPLPVVLFPTVSMPLHIFEPRYRRMVERCLGSDRRFGLVYHDADVLGPFLMEEGRVGCLAEIRDFQPLPDGRSLLVVRGMERFQIVDGIESTEPFYEALVAPYLDDTTELVALEHQRRRTLALFEAVVRGLAGHSEALPDIDVSRELSFPLARAIEVEASWRQGFLEMKNEILRLERLDAVFQAIL